MSDPKLFGEMLNSKDLPIIFNQLLENELFSIDDTPPSVAGKMFCRGSRVFGCPREDPFHLIDEDSKCIASRKHWAKLKSALSLKWENVKKNDQPLQVLLDSTKWHDEDYMVGIQVIVQSADFLPFDLHQWYLDADPIKCTICGQYLHLYYSVQKDCKYCGVEKMPQRSLKPFASILTLPHKYDNIPDDVECVIFPINRISDGTSVPENYFKCVMDMVADFSKQGHIPKSYFKMQNTAGNGNCRAFHFAMTYACIKQVKDVDGSQQGVYAPIASLPHRIVLVYDPKRIIYLAMLHPSCFLLNPNALICFFEELKSFGLDLEKIIFLYSGLKLRENDIVAQPTQVSAAKLLSALLAKVPPAEASLGVAAILHSMFTQSNARLNHGVTVTKGRSGAKKKRISE